MIIPAPINQVLSIENGRRNRFKHPRKGSGSAHALMIGSGIKVKTNKADMEVEQALKPNSLWKSTLKSYSPASCASSAWCLPPTPPREL